MTQLPQRLHTVLRRITTALDHLDAAVERRVLADRLQLDLFEEYTVMQDDRARLGIELESSALRARQLEQAAREAGKKLERASITIRSILTAHEQD